MSSGQKEWYLDQQTEKLQKSDAYISGVMAERRRVSRIVDKAVSGKISAMELRVLVASGMEP